VDVQILDACKWLALAMYAYKLRHRLELGKMVVAVEKEETRRRILVRRLAPRVEGAEGGHHSILPCLRYNHLRKETVILKVMNYILNSMRNWFKRASLPLAYWTALIS